MSLHIEIDVKDKHSIVIRPHGELWLLCEAGDEISQAVENVIHQYQSVFDKVNRHASDH